MSRDRKIYCLQARPSIFQPEILHAGAVKGLMLRQWAVRVQVFGDLPQKRILPFIFCSCSWDQIGSQRPLMLPQSNENIHLIIHHGSFFFHFLRQKPTSQSVVSLWLRLGTTRLAMQLRRRQKASAISSCRGRSGCFAK